ncbi:tripartite tricarboxylate transporter TctB family protein [Fusibacter ferrireducens]|uniref:Tripartite tricarboxylate transporter TctB family protein n=1 Tax=Fusibacter ferrireducens TaxID=2785058 RepID=A0ABR9ZRR3_9FIRM|nr:tripartite tricarboxylate transporter TctB family protein [Fusibacter ferrireducens]MBF4693147.1 tripartite tricarboxylate transporter TctB family protein [Fusibacter ferrireducens]
MTKKIDVFISLIIRGFYTYSDIVLGFIIVAVSAGLYMNTSHLKVSAQSITPMDSAQFVPKLTFGILIFLGIIILLQGVKKIKENKKALPEGEQLIAAIIGFKRATIALTSIALFILLMTRISFIIAAILYLMFNMYFMVERRGWKHKTYFITAVIVSISLYYLFNRFIYVKLPLGFLKGVIG